MCSSSEPGGGAFPDGGEATALVVRIMFVKPSRLRTRERRPTTAAVEVAPVLTIAAATAAEFMCGGRLRYRESRNVLGLAWVADENKLVGFGERTKFLARRRPGKKKNSR